MTLEIKGSRNYSATVIRVPKVRKAENSDRLYIVDALGMTAIVDDSWIAREDELALIFPAEVQLSHDFTSNNNLYRDHTLNANAADVGYIENNRRVRAMKLRGNISNGLVMPLSSIANVVELGGMSTELTEGTVFDTYNGHEICRKYEIPVKPGTNHADAKIKKAFKRVDVKYLPEHFETGQWLREEHSVRPDEELIITQKLHGTSVRLANTIVMRQPTWLDKIAQKLGVGVREHDYDLVAGSKRVIKDPNNPKQQHFYGTDVWTHALEVFGNQIPKNFVVYGELVGFTSDGAAIQKGHTYEASPSEMNLYVYRVAIITEGAELVDLTWDAVKDFCSRHGFTTVPELDRMPKAVFDVSEYNEKNFRYDAERSPELYTDLPVRLSEGGTGVDEGIAIRVDRGLTPELYKFKFNSHYLYETAQLDSDEVDLESGG